MNAVLVMTPEQVRDLVRAAVREELAAHQGPERDVLTAEHVAEMLDVHVRTVTKLVARDGLPAHRLGRALTVQGLGDGSQTARSIASTRRDWRDRSSRARSITAVPLRPWPRMCSGIWASLSGMALAGACLRPLDEASEEVRSGKTQHDADDPR
jgi:excisionase family DNA binding protein